MLLEKLPSECRTLKLPFVSTCSGCRHVNYCFVHGPLCIAWLYTCECSPCIGLEIPVDVWLTRHISTFPYISKLLSTPPRSVPESDSDYYFLLWDGAAIFTIGS